MTIKTEIVLLIIVFITLAVSIVVILIGAIIELRSLSAHRKEFEKNNPTIKKDNL